MLLLDTSVLLHLIRGNEVGKRIEATYGLRTRAERPLISIVTVGEAHAFARHRGWGAQKLTRLAELVRELVVVDIRSATVITRYAEIDAHLKKNGRAVSDNDTWIAATASATGARLITNDRDFDPLDPTFLVRDYIDPREPPRSGDLR